MTTTLKIGRKRMLPLPRDIFKPNDRVALFREGTTVIVKKLSPIRLSDFAAREKSPAMSLKNIAKEVQAYRRERRRARSA